MTLDLGLALRQGAIWGLVGVLLLIIASFVGPFSPITVDGLSIGTFAVMFSGVGFAYYNPGRQLLTSLFGGAIAGIVAGALLLVITLFVLPLIPNVNADASASIGGTAATVLINALLAGVAGAAGMLIIKRSS